MQLQKLLIIEKNDELELVQHSDSEIYLCTIDYHNIILICNSNSHDKNCPSYTDNRLKGASAVVQQNPTFSQGEISILEKVLRICQLYLKNNNFQNNDISKDILSAMNILSARRNKQKIYLLKK